MASPALSSLVGFLQEKEFVTREQLGELTQNPQFQEAAALLRELVKRGWLTAFQANQLAHGNGKDLVLGSYRLLEPIGEGGMGKVFKARHVRMDRIVALKIIPEELLANPQAVARFNREVRAVAQLSHPNIVTAYEVNQEGETHYFAMEFMEGIDLGKLVRQSGPLPIPQACDYIRQAALGLQHAHEKGLVHRDIKPGNLIVGRTTAGGDPVVKILDFGLARFESQDAQATRVTKIGHVIGTVDYISPEQAGDAREVDIRADIYSLGCSLFFLLTGKPPFEGADSMERMIARVVNDAPSVRTLRPEVPAELEKVLARMLTRNPADRYASPAEVAAALEPFVRPEAAQPKPAATAVQPGRPRIPAGAPSNVWGSLTEEEAVLAKPKKKGQTLPKAWLGAGIFIGAIIVSAGFLLVNRGTKPEQTVSRPPKTKLVVDPLKKEPRPPEGKKTETPPPTFKNGLGMEFVLVPKGKSWLGGGGGNPGTTEVDIPYDFYLGRYEVTQEEWEKITALNPSGFKAVAEVGKEDQKRFPVESVSRDDAQVFIERLNKQVKEAGWVYRLPTQVEWEYACRGGPMKDRLESAFDFYFEKPTNTLLPQQANFEHGKGLKRTCKVGSYQPNRLGLYDMHGNVWELFANDDKRLGRGGGWGDVAGSCRAVVHIFGPLSYRGNHLGLRLARVPVGKEIVKIIAPEKKKPAVETKNAATFKNGLGIEFVLVPKGKSWLGGGGDTPGYREMEIPYDFYLGKYEVTQEEWEQVTGINPSSFKAVAGVSKEDQKRFPVENVSWDDAQLFLSGLNGREKEAGWVYRLPKEAEWEYACRGGPLDDKLQSAFDFYFDNPTNQLLPDQANFAHGKGLQRTCKVGTYKPNRLGLYDMHGNVWEWCDDARASQRVYRGGCWQFDSGLCRAANPGSDPPSARTIDIGLRLARVPVGKIAAVKDPPAKPEKSLTNSIGMKLVYIPPGKFTMGSPQEEQGRRADEEPAREVEITRGFQMGKFEVTRGQYRKVMGMDPSRSGGFPSDDSPVENISWDDAVEFCRKLSDLEKKTYDLPTEAEWEYACRAGTQTAYHFGGSLSKAQANFKPDLEWTTKVGSYPPNAWGLHDMHGNVREWCKDWYKSNYYVDGPRRDPPGPPGGTERVARGGSFGTFVADCRAADRHSLPREFRSQYVGFRVVCRVP